MNPKAKACRDAAKGDASETRPELPMCGSAAQHKLGFDRAAIVYKQMI